MKILIRLAVVGAIAAFAATLAIQGVAVAAPRFDSSLSAGQVFVQSDNPEGNTVVVYDRALTGKLTQAGVYPTGGLGGALPGSVVDHLASQGALAYDRQQSVLYAVNAGSNSIAVFSVFGDRLVRTQVLPSGGIFPVSIAVHRDQVFVLNAQGGASIQGYERFGGLLVSIPGWKRKLALGTTLATTFTGTPGQISFDPSGRHLLVTTKNATNSIDVFSVDPFAGPSAAPIVTSLAAGTVPFAMTFDRGGHLVVAEAGPSAVATFTLAPNDQLDQIAQLGSGQAATCWIAADGASLYTSNAGSATESSFQDLGNGHLTLVGTTPTGSGTVDAAVTPGGRFLYVQAGTNGIVDEFRTLSGGGLAEVGSVTVPGGVGGEGIAAD